MSARGDYPFPVAGWTYERMIDEIDRLRAEAASGFKVNAQSLTGRIRPETADALLAAIENVQKK